jgi:hypothetical protein
MKKFYIFCIIFVFSGLQATATAQKKNMKAKQSVNFTEMQQIQMQSLYLDKPTYFSNKKTIEAKQIVGLNTAKLERKFPKQPLPEAVSDVQNLQKQRANYKTLVASRMDALGKSGIKRSKHAKVPNNDATYQRLDSVVQVYANGENATHEIFRYNGYGNDTEVIRSMWIGNGWQVVHQVNYEYDNLQRNTVAQEIYPQDGVGTRFDVEYNVQNLPVSQIVSEYSGGDWLPVQKTSWQYERGNITEEIFFEYDNGNWVNVIKSTAQYDAQNRQLTLYNYFWNGSQWEGQDYFEYEYYGNSSEATGYTYYFWGDSDWVESYRLHSEFTNNKLTLQEQFFWDADANQWEVFDRTTLVYDEFGRQTYEENYNNYNTDEFALAAKIEYTYTEEADGVTRINKEYFLMDNSAWLKNREVITRYKAGKKIFERFEYLRIEDGFWQYEIEEQSEYNAAGYETLYIVYTFDDNNNKLAMDKIIFEPDVNGNVLSHTSYQGLGTSDNDWTEYGKFDYTYENSLETSRKRYTYENNEWLADWGTGTDYDFNVPLAELVIPIDYGYSYKVNHFYYYEGDGSTNWLNPPTTMTYYYSPFQLSGIDDVKDDELLIYPNPTSDVLYISTKADKVSVVIYSLQGQTLLHSSQKQIDLSAFASGVYIIDVNGTRGKIVKR